jgi:hypothetical protein
MLSKNQKLTLRKTYFYEFLEEKTDGSVYVIEKYGLAPQFSINHSYEDLFIPNFNLLYHKAISCIVQKNICKPQNIEIVHSIDEADCIIRVFKKIHNEFYYGANTFLYSTYGADCFTFDKKKNKWSSKHGDTIIFLTTPYIIFRERFNAKVKFDTEFQDFYVKIN